MEPQLLAHPKPQIHFLADDTFSHVNIVQSFMQIHRRQKRGKGWG